MALMAISTAYMCFRSASDAVYWCMSSTASSRVMVAIMSLPSLLWGLRIARREGNPASQLTVEADLESILARTGQGNVEYQHRSGLHIHHAGRWLPELDSA